MATSPPSAYEPYRHVQEVDEYNAEKPLVPRLHEQNHGRQQNPRRLRSRVAPNHIRVTLRALALLLTFATLAVQAHSVYSWLSTRHYSVFNVKNGLRTRVWAVIDIWPTWTMLGASLISIVVHLLSLTTLCSCFRRLRGSLWHALSVYFSSGLLIVVWIAAVVYFKEVDVQGEKKSHWDLWSWSCNEKSKHGKVPWAAMCIEQDYTFIASIMLIIVEIVGLSLFIISRRSQTTQTLYRKV